MKAIFPVILLGLLAWATPRAEAGDLTLRTVDGQVFTGCRVVKADPDGLFFAHSRGAAKVPFSRLAPEVRQQFGYDAAAATEFVREHVEAEREAARQRQERRAARRLEQERAYASLKIDRRHNVQPSHRWWHGGGGFDCDPHACLPPWHHGKTFFMAPTLTFGGYRLPTLPASHWHGGHHPGFFAPRPGFFQSCPSAFSSGGLRPGGTGSLVRVSSPCISHR